MPGLEEAKTVWRYRVADPGKFEKFRVKDFGGGVKITLGKVKGSDRWEIQNYMFEKSTFKDAETVRKWLDQHIKANLNPDSALNYGTWNEYKRQVLRAFLEISSVSE
jgi:hypothetical protein